MTVNLDQQEWNNLLAVLSQAPWNVANPLIMKIGEQLRMQSPGPGAMEATDVVNDGKTDRRSNSGAHRDS